jgi:hypothetical protein
MDASESVSAIADVHYTSVKSETIPAFSRLSAAFPIITNLWATNLW